MLLDFLKKENNNAEEVNVKDKENVGNKTM
jgi:hypothetical protein